ncbi:MAG: hypothetical protein ACLFVS_04810 [Candidatus Acetothermia bacterium]
MNHQRSDGLFRRIFVWLTFGAFVASSTTAARFHFLEEAFYPVDKLETCPWGSDPLSLPLFWGTIVFAVIFLAFWFRSNASKSPNHVFKVLLFFVPNFLLALAVSLAIFRCRTVFGFVNMSDYSSFFSNYRGELHLLFVEKGIFRLAVGELYESKLFLLYWFWTPQVLTFFLTFVLYPIGRLYYALSPETEVTEDGGETGSSVTRDRQPKEIANISEQVDHWEEEGYNVTELKEMLEEWQT